MAKTRKTHTAKKKTAKPTAKPNPKRTRKQTIQQRIRDNKARFLAGYAQYGSIYHGCQAAGITRRTYYDWRASDTEFAKSCEEILEDCIDQVESTLFLDAKTSGNAAAQKNFLAARRAQLYRDKEAKTEIHVGTVAPGRDGLYASIVQKVTAASESWQERYSPPPVTPNVE